LPAKTAAGKSKMNGEFSKYKSLIKLMEATPKVNVSEGFTETVMKRLPNRYAGLRFKTFSLSCFFYRRALMWTRSCSFDPATQECSYYFLIIGSFYLIMAMVLMIGFKEKSSSLAAMDWIRLQPHVTLGIAMWLLALGSILMMDGRNIVRMVRLGTLFYIFFTIVNGILMRHYFNIPYGDIFLVGFVGGCVFIGILLAFAVKKMELRHQ